MRCGAGDHLVESDAVVEHVHETYEERLADLVEEVGVHRTTLRGLF